MKRLLIATGSAALQHSDDENDVARFTMESANGTNAEVRNFAGRMLPTLQSHLQVAEHDLDAIRGC